MFSISFWPPKNNPEADPFKFPGISRGGHKANTNSRNCFLDFVLAPKTTPKRILYYWSLFVRAKFSREKTKQFLKPFLISFWPPKTSQKRVLYYRSIFGGAKFSKSKRKTISENIFNLVGSGSRSVPGSGTLFLIYGSGFKLNSYQNDLDPKQTPCSLLNNRNIFVLFWCRGSI